MKDLQIPEEEIILIDEALTHAVNVVKDKAAESETAKCRAMRREAIIFLDPTMKRL